MGIFTTKLKMDDRVKRSVLNKLRNTSDSELVRWIDNINTGVGKDLLEIRKSLTHGEREQALIYIADIRSGSVSLLAAMQVLEERCTPIR
jgi:hypothetical protein